MVLFTGAGFSSLARDKSGKRHVPTGAPLADELWQLCFGGEKRDGSSLADLYAHALASRRRALAALIEQRLRVDGRTLPSLYETWLTMLVAARLHARRRRPRDGHRRALPIAAALARAVGAA